MNHLGDTNKMVDTPMTDAHIDGLRRDPEVSGCDRTLNFCRQLERELNQACEMYRKLDIHALNLIDRIWRLEEAGDALLELCEADESKFHLADHIDARCDAWLKAKEAKP